ncbi:hypothetical protein JB92DRAFT_2976191 [Gautieria morchelliformis]|nr:hypothetical protein JB92DRAFT_2976191 [Gautieria morchelliformis]
MVTYSGTEVNVGTFITSRNTGNSQAKSTEGNDGLALRGLEIFPSSLPRETNRGVICNRRNWRNLTCELDTPTDSFEPGLVRYRDDSGGHLGIVRAASLYKCSRNWISRHLSRDARWGNVRRWAGNKHARPPGMTVPATARTRSSLAGAASQKTCLQGRRRYRVLLQMSECYLDAWKHRIPDLGAVDGQVGPEQSFCQGNSWPAVIVIVSLYGTTRKA